MALPNLTAAGYLPPGVHSCSLDDVGARFGWNARRRELLDRLDGFLCWLQAEHQLSCDFYIGGSFMTAKDEPGDVDLVLDVSSARPAKLIVALQLFASERARLKREFEIDYWFTHGEASQPLHSFFAFPRLEEVLALSLTSSTRRGVAKVVVL